MNLSTLLALFARCEPTPHHAATEVALIVNKENVNDVMLSLPPLLRDALREFAVEYQPGRMLSTYGDSYIPSPDSIDCIKDWLIRND